MRYCRFCGNIEAAPSKLCKQCGYLLKKVRSFDNIKSKRFSRIGVLQIHFDRSGLLSKKTPPKKIVFDGYDLFMFWTLLCSAYRHNQLNYEVTAGTLTLYTALQGKHNILSCENFPSHIPSTIAFAQELIFDRPDPATGYRVYKAERMPKGSLSVDSLSQTQRVRFLKWFLATYPHATPEGTLCFEI